MMKSRVRPLVYLGGPIDGMSEGQSLLPSLDALIASKTSMVTFRPYTAFGFPDGYGGSKVQGLAGVNAAAISQSALVIFDCRVYAGPSFGTCAEMHLCDRSAIPYVVLIPPSFPRTSLEGYYLNAGVFEVKDDDDALLVLVSALARLATVFVDFQHGDISVVDRDREIEGASEGNFAWLNNERGWHIVKRTYVHRMQIMTQQQEQA